MSTQQIIERLRAMVNTPGIGQEDCDTLCAAIRALGGKP